MQDWIMGISESNRLKLRHTCLRFTNNQSTQYAEDGVENGLLVLGNAGELLGRALTILFKRHNIRLLEIVFQKLSRAKWNWNGQEIEEDG
jgi:hypothetical protein